MKTKIIVLFASLIFSATAFAGDNVGDTPYDKVGRGSDGKVVQVSDYKGKVVIVTFWATWCGPCMKELPVLSGIQNQAGTERLQVIAVNLKESKKRFRQIADALADFPLIVSHDAKGSFSRKYDVGGIPHMVIIGRDGLIRSIHKGYNEEKLPDLVTEINAYLAEPTESDAIAE